jgi:drug/metabolite transporter (DMT)-like permease
MLTVLIGLTSALVYGAADFLGGTASRRISPVRVTAVAALTGLAVMLLAVATVPAFSGYWSGDVIVLGALSGVAGAVAIGLLYACLAIGPMSILSPLTAVVSAVVPLSIGLVGGERLQTIGYVALGLALVAVVLVGFVPEKGAVRPSLRGVLMAIGSGACIGVFLVIIDQTPDDSGLVPLVVNRAVTAAIMFSVVGLLAVIAFSRRSGAVAEPVSVAEPVAVAQPVSVAEPASVAEPVEAPRPARAWLPGLRLSIACGIVDAVANAGLLLGVRIGELSIMAVLTALYPAGTIILAAVVLKERIAPVQVVGLVLAVAAGAMLALA